MKAKIGALFLFPSVIVFLAVFLLVLQVRRSNSSPQTAGTPTAGVPQSEAKPTPTPDPAQLAAEAKKQQEEESRRFNALYGPCRYIPILTYHHIGDGTNSLYVKTEIFNQQTDYLLQKGYQTVTLSEVMQGLKGQGSLPAKPVVLTFDDGYRDFYTNAFPILSAKNLKATLFVISQLAGGGDYITWEQLGQVAGSGLVTIGDHTLSHVSLPSVGADKTYDQIVSAKSILESKLGRPVNVFAYPYGANSDEAEKVLADNGFVAAVTTKRGQACAKLPYELPRVRIGNASMAAYGL